MYLFNHALGPMRRFGWQVRVLVLLSAVNSALYLLAQTWRLLPGSVVCKALSIAPLAALAALFALADKPRSDYLILAGALICSCAGDILLDLDGERLFAPGLLAFLFAHLLYLALFLRHRPRPFKLSNVRWVRLAAVLLLSLTLGGLLAPHLGELRWPVLFYICAITAMVAAAIIARFRWPWVWMGATLFLISDSIIAIHKFLAPVAARDFLVWVTYYLGQCGIALGFLYEKAKRKQ